MNRYLTFPGWRRSKALVLALVAVMMMGAGPRLGCICSDGHYEPFCWAMATGADEQGNEATRPARCSCCAAAEMCSGTKSCCQSKQESSPPCSGNGDGLAAVQKSCCCHPFVFVAAVFLKQRDSQVAAVKPVDPLAIVCDRIAPVVQDWDLVAIGWWRHSLPPPDLVIRLHRLTI